MSTVFVSSARNNMFFQLLESQDIVSGQSESLFLVTI